MKLKDLLVFNSISKKFLIPTLILTVILLGGLGSIIVRRNQATVRSLMESKRLKEFMPPIRTRESLS